MGYYDFPHTRNYDQDLGFLIKKYKELGNDYEELDEKYKTLIEIYKIISKDVENITTDILKKWLEDGTLETILANHLDIAITIDTTVNMLTGDKLLESGNVIKTLGYRTVGDGGGATFVITQEEPSTYHFKIDKLDLYAKIVTENKMNVLQFGIEGDGVTDITEQYQQAINHVHEYGDNYLFIPNGNYFIDGVDHSKAPSDSGHLLDGGGIKCLDGLSLVHDENAILNIIPTNYQAYNLYRIYNVKNVSIKGGIFNGDRDNHYGSYGGEWGYLIAITGSRNINIENVTCKNGWGDGINIQYAWNETSLSQKEKISTNITIKKAICDMNLRQGMSIENGENIRIIDCEFTNTNGTSPQAGIDIEPATTHSPVNNVEITNCLFYGNQGRNLTTYSQWDTSKITNINVNNCIFKECYDGNKYNIVVDASSEGPIIFNNVNFDFTSLTNNITVLTGGNVIYNNCSFNNNKFLLYNTNYKTHLFNCDINFSAFTETAMFDLQSFNELMFNNCNMYNYTTNNGLYCNYDKGTVYIINSFMKALNKNTGFIQLDYAPNTKIVAFNNYIVNGNKWGGITTYDYRNVQEIANGGIPCMVFKKSKSAGGLPTTVQEGSFGFYREGNIPIFYTGDKWIKADGTEI